MSPALVSGFFTTEPWEHEVDGAALQGGFAGLVAVVEASVPAVQRPGQ